MRIGVFGGTFNPVHNGHLQCAEFIRGKLALDKVLFVPTKVPVHKKIDGNVSAEDRLAMLKLALAAYPHFALEHVEIEREEPSFTVITIGELRQKYKGAELFLIIGADSFNTIDTWFRWEEILSDVMIVVMARQGDEELRTDLVHRTPQLIQAGNSLVNISSSMLRQMIRDGKDISGLAPKTVLDYIKEKGLYLQT